MPLTMSERLAEMCRRMARLDPAADGAAVREALNEILRQVEDEHSGVPEDPDFHLTKESDGRMYPPLDDSEIASPSNQIRSFRNRGHITHIGDNGSIKIVKYKSGVVSLDLPGADGRTIDTMLTETAT